MDGYTRLDIQMMAVQTFFTIKDVLEGKRDGHFRLECRRELQKFSTTFDLHDFLQESNSYGNFELEQVFTVCMKWLALLDITPVKSGEYELEPIKEYYNYQIGKDSARGQLVVNYGNEDLLSTNDKENNYWLLTDDGYLEFHGGGYLRNSYGEILCSYCGKDVVGSEGIETGLLNILNYGSQQDVSMNGKQGNNLPETYTRNKAIEMMLDAKINYYTKNTKDLGDRSGWQWNLAENLTNNEVRSIKLPEDVFNFYKQFEPGWKQVEEGFIGADYTDEPGAKVKYHVGVDWVWRMNNQNKTVSVKIISTTSGNIPKIDGINRTDSDGRGKYIRVESEDGSRVDYMHMKSISPSLKNGEPVIAGVTVLGEAGTTGTANAHLHIAKSYAINDDFDERGLNESKYDGEELTNSQYLRYVSKETNKKGDRAYVSPPIPIIPKE